MPDIQKVYTLSITVEQFINACSRTELIELGFILDSPRIQEKIKQQPDTDFYDEYQVFPIKLKSDDQH